ncbi:39S ribosomal protein L54, mitochondrial [Thalassophryne amazonica]|uniref:39S ribosomal protein L54, mitochondrial n=1 Tax=Thalassophryne amazonica TaxID=390379 RepID=UPI0014717451|nr:39S ribosomal protein L54, mitochondrial [Thalassophryne amazonica]
MSSSISGRIIMSGYRLFSTFTITKCITSRLSLGRIQTCGYAKKVAFKGKGKSVVQEELKGPEVCKDPIKLTTYAVGVNFFKQGEDPKLKPREEYPEWLYDLNLGNPKKLHELEPNSWEYFKRLRKENIWRSNRLRKGKKM